MTITSINFLLMITAGAAVYYVVPKRARWIVLLALSLLFYWFAGVRYTFAYIAFSTAVIYVVSNLFERPKIAESQGKQRALLITGIILCILPWLLTAGSGLWRIGALYERTVPLPAALGMGYYTSMTISYMTDCYWKIVKPQKNPLKMLLYVSFFPQLVTGPISKYEKMQALYAGHALSYKNVTFGAQRILWGMMKKLILAERMALIVNGIWNDLEGYGGLWHWLALFIYPVYLYADFSGCMDICIGTAEVFGIRLPENFNNPFFSRNVGEFWRRWHITLGQWAKDYVMYPLLKSPLFLKMGKRLREKTGKAASKFIVTAIASGFVWLVMGVWHGAVKYIVGVSFYFWIMLELGELFSLLSHKLTKKWGIDTETFRWHLLQSIKVYIIYSFGAVFFAAPGVWSAFGFIKSLFTMFPRGENNPWIIFRDDILTMGVSWGDINLIILMILLLVIVAVLRERHGYARSWMAKQGLAFRWITWAAMFFALLAWGRYGTGYDPAAFIYQGF